MFVNCLAFWKLIGDVHLLLVLQLQELCSHFFMAADWSKLEFDVLHEIVTRLETIEDFVYFSVVCRWWNHFATTVKHKLDLNTMPWLLLAENTQNKGNPDSLRKVFNPFNNKSYSLKLPEAVGCRCWGSAHGWLVTFNLDLEFHLFNPLTKVRVNLPPFSSLPYQFGLEYTAKEMRSEFMRKAFVLKVDEDDVIVFVSYYYSWKKLAFARPGDQSWTSIDQPGRTLLNIDETDENLSNYVAEVVCHSTLILILYEDTSVGYLDMSDLNDPAKLIVKDYLPKHPMILSDPRNLGLKAREYIPALPGILDEFDPDRFGSYLVKSCGDVYMVLRDRCYLNEDEDEDKFVYATFGFKVYQLDFDKKKWLEVQDIGDVALFIGNSSSMSVPTLGAVNRKSNCIYLVDDCDNCWVEPKRFGGDDMRIFHLENSQLDDLYDGCDKRSKVQPPLWFMPRF